MTGVLYLQTYCYLDVTRLTYSNNIQGYFPKLLIICAVSYPPSLSRKDTNFKTSIPLRNRIALSFNKLSSGNLLHGCAEIYGFHENITSIIVGDFCVAIEKHLNPILIEK
jgi:hypothetical protein